MTNIIKHPSAPTSYLNVRQNGRFFDLALVTPCGVKPLVTILRRWSDRESAVADGAVTAKRMQRPFKDATRAK
jgi:hypothetical protein